MATRVGVSYRRAYGSSSKRSQMRDPGRVKGMKNGSVHPGPVVNRHRQSPTGMVFSLFNPPARCRERPPWQSGPNRSKLPSVGWVERSEPHHFLGEFLWWGSLHSTHPTGPGKAAMSETERNVSRLIEKARQGDAPCRDQLFELCRSYLGFAARAQVESWLRRKVDASDLVQETMLEAFRDFDHFEGRSEQEWLAWLRRILAHNAADFVRRYRGTAKRQVRREVSFRDLRTTGLKPRGSRAGRPGRYAQPGVLADRHRVAGGGRPGPAAAGLPGSDRAQESPAAALQRGGRADGPLPAGRADALDAGDQEAARGARRRQRCVEWLVVGGQWSEATHAGCRQF